MMKVFFLELDTAYFNGSACARTVDERQLRSVVVCSVSAARLLFCISDKTV
jgi:hypothetical protein